MKRKKLLLPLLLALTLLLSACDASPDVLFTAPPASSGESDSIVILPVEEPGDVSSEQFEETEAPEGSEEATVSLDPEGYYYDLENVVLYLDTYEELPPNYITKSEARELGWQGGSVERYLEGAAIGGDRFGNREGLLPKESGRNYTECDLNTDGESSRGAERLIFSNDGLYFYTADHYESFTEVWVEDGTVVAG